MSDMFEKLEQRRPSVGGRAQARRSQLLARWGSRWGSTTEGPELIIVESMGRRETWEKIHGDLFELKSSGVCR